MTSIERWLRLQQHEQPRLLVVGGASLDLIHVDGVPVPTPGGAGLYTALAAARAGVRVTMLAPVPDPMPPSLAPARALIEWVGPQVPIDGLPRFEIAYDADGAVTLFREHLGAEPDMTPALLDLLDEVPDCAFCVPFLDARLQQAFIRALAARGCLTVAGTYGKAARAESDVVRQTAALADVWCCNADEAAVLFDGAAGAVPAGRLRFVTRGRHGVTVVQGEHHTDVPAQPAHAIDPTGAGDTFCGTTVARLLLGDHPVEAARWGAAAAAEMVAHLGPVALWAPGPPPRPAVDERAVVDQSAVRRLAALMASHDDLQPFDFTGELFPAVGAGGAADWFMAATLEQYGFWHDADGRYQRPMIARIDGAERKGSDYLWAQYLRWHADDPRATTAAVQSQLTDVDWFRLAADDEGADPYPDPEQRVASAVAYGRSLRSLGAEPAELLATAAAAPRPMRALLRILDHVGGYREDPLRKKAALLGVILRQRPERFLPDAAGDDAPPIVDYHVQRTGLRTGIVDVTDASLRARLVRRELLTADEESAVRRATFAAVEGLVRESGRPMGAVDWFLFQMRHRCPEMTPPHCASCPAEPACNRRVELFQPVLRTTAY